MTTIVSRLYADPGTAQDIAARLTGMGLPASTCDVLGADADAARIRAARVPAGPANAYAAHLAAAGGALVVARVPFSPIGAARAAIEIADSAASVDLGLAEQNAYLAEQPDPRFFLSVLTDHPRFASHDLRPGYSEVYGPVTSLFGFSLLSRRKPKTSAMRGGAYMSRMFWPMPLVTRNRRARSALGTSGHVSRTFWPMPLIARRAGR